MVRLGVINRVLKDSAMFQTYFIYMIKWWGNWFEGYLSYKNYFSNSVGI